MIGTIAFAISGAMVAIQKKMDILGIYILGMTTAVGGGITRDIILGITPPSAFHDPFYAITALVTSLVLFLFARQKKIRTTGWLFPISYSLGLAVFTMAGALMGVVYDNLFLIIFVGTITGVGGGIIRDVFANRIPIIFQTNIYATSSLIGATVFALLYKYDQYLAAIIGGGVIFVLRILDTKYDWSLPRVK